MCGRLRLRAFVSLGRLFFVKLVAAPETSVGTELLGLLEADCCKAERPSVFTFSVAVLVAGTVSAGENEKMIKRVR